MRVLITGFGTFADVLDNPSGRLALHVGQTRLPGHDLTTAVLPVSFRRADDQIRATLRTGSFDLALLLGVASTSSQFRLETLAANEDRARIPDCDGESPQSAPASTTGPESLRTPFALDRLQAALLGQGFPVVISENAGRYVCNRTYYAALHEIAESALATRCLFLHVPPDETTFGPESQEPFVPFAEQVELLHAVLDLLTTT